MPYAIYLRKSRADLEAEARGEGETLSRHRRTLLDLADARHYAIGEIYEEIVSGDTITDRPQMRRLLHDIEQRRWEGVLVMDVDRLGRGDSIDQGTIVKTFKYSNTKIITIYKVFDPNNEMDEEFFEYNQYTSRAEYRRIKRRMWAGRVASAREGKYQSPKPPFGYERVKLRGERGWTLAPVPDQADTVRMIFDLYAHGEGAEPVGMDRIAQRVNAMGFHTFTGKRFDRSTIREILRNPAYTGKIRWNMRRKATAMVDGQEITTRPLSDECFTAPGRHPAIVDQALFDEVQLRMRSNPSHKKNDRCTVNPYSGLITCSECGHTMVLTPVYDRKTDGAIRCMTSGCPTSRIDVEYVEAAVLDTLRDWLRLSELPETPAPSAPAQPPVSSMRAKLEAQLVTLKAQQSRLRDLLEQGIYSVEVYLERNQELSSRMEAAQSELDALTSSTAPTEADAIRRLRPRILHVLDAWDATPTPAERNVLLRSVISRIIYHKLHRCTRRDIPSDYLKLDVMPVYLDS